MKLLIVDDEQMTRTGLKMKIDWLKMGISEVEFACNGLQAFDIARRFCPDIIITDIKMPRMGGIEFVEALRKDLPNCKVIFLTGYAGKENLKSAIKVRAIEFVEKPINLVEIKTAVEMAIREIKEHSNETGDREASTRILPDDLDITNTVNEILHYIHHHYNQELTIDKIASSICLTTVYICQLFKKQTGMTINDYINRYRIEKSKNLLLNTKNKIYEIASLVGYKDAQYYARVFKKYTGTTPFDFREGKLE